MDRVILELVNHVVGGDGVVDGDNFNVVTERSFADGQTSDSAEAVDTHFYTHCQISPLLHYSFVPASQCLPGRSPSFLLYTIIPET